MADETAPRPRGEAAWKAQRDTVEMHNAAAKKKAREQRTTTDGAVSDRERRLELQEQAQLRALNARLDAS